MRAQFITASEVAEIMGISRSKAYQIVREMRKRPPSSHLLAQMEGSRLTIQLTSNA